MNFFEGIVGNVVDAGRGFYDGITGASKRKRKAAQEKQRRAKKRKAEVKRKSEAVSKDLSEAVQEAQRINKLQDKSISSAEQLARRSLSTSRAQVFASRELQKLVNGIRKDLKELANTSASIKSLSETNETIAVLGKKLEEMSKADAEYKEATDEAIEALNQEASDTTAHLDTLTEANQKKGDWDKLATDALPWARVALSALNRESPTNDIAYYAYLAAGPFLRERLDPTIAELVITGLQILAYWDDDGIRGLLKTRNESSQYETELIKATVLDEFVNREDVIRILRDNNITVPKTR